MTTFTMHPCLCIDEARQIYQVVGVHRPLIDTVYEMGADGLFEVVIHGLALDGSAPIPMGRWSLLDNYLIMLGSVPSGRVLASGGADIVKRLYPGIDWREMLK